MVFFKQCLFVKPETSETHIAWIPEEFAKPGKVLSLKFGEKWDDGWVVGTTYTQAEESYVREHERDYLTQHEASDKLTPNKGLFNKK